jgi:hypothetical protein
MTHPSPHFLAWGGARDVLIATMRRGCAAESCRASVLPLLSLRERYRERHARGSSYRVTIHVKFSYSRPLCRARTRVGRRCQRRSLTDRHHCFRPPVTPPRHRNPCDVAPKHTEDEDRRHLRRPPPPRCGLLQHDLGKHRGHGSTACGAFFGGAAAEPVYHARHTDCMLARQHHWRPSRANPMLPCTRNIHPPRTQADRRSHLGPRPCNQHRPRH